MLFTSDFVDVIRPTDPRHERIARKNAELFTRPPNENASSDADEISNVLRRHGKNISEENLIDSTSPGGAAIEFASLDRATSTVFDRLVREQAKLFASCFPKAVPEDPKTLLLAVGGHLFIGFIVARRLFGTHKAIVEFSGNSADVAEKTAALEAICRNARPENLLRAAGDHFFTFLMKWAFIHSKTGIYSEITTADAGREILYATLLNGWMLGVAEYQMTLPK